MIYRWANFTTVRARNRTHEIIVGTDTYNL
jgi:hypothetical protein